MAVTINGTTGIETNTDTGKIKVGVDDDLTLEHRDNNWSYIQHTGSGNLAIESVNSMYLRNTSGEIYFYGEEDSYSAMYHNNAKKIETTSTGATVHGNLKLASAGQGIDFSATSDAGGMSSEVLDDYEEGTFSPVLGGSTNHGSYNITGNGDYVKIGKMVSCHISFSNKDLSDSAGGTVRIAGLPYTSAGVEYTVTTNHYMYHVDFNTSRIQSWYLHTGSTEMDGIESVADGGWVSWPVTDFNRSGMYLRIQMNYLVA